jgi:hypothetical protein
LTISAGQTNGGPNGQALQLFFVKLLPKRSSVAANCAIWTNLMLFTPFCKFKGPRHPILQVSGCICTSRTNCWVSSVFNSFNSYQSIWCVNTCTTKFETCSYRSIRKLRFSLVEKRPSIPVCKAH